MRKPNSPVGPRLICDACRRSHPLTKKNVYLTRWTGLLNSIKTPLVDLKRGVVVATVCWECVENMVNPPSIISCYNPPLLEMEKTSILQYMRRSSTGNRLHPSAKFPPFCIGCQMLIAENTSCVYSRLTTERALSGIPIKIENPIDVGIVCTSCSIKFWGKYFTASQK
jgi:hypothetical protein